MGGHRCARAPIATPEERLSWFIVVATVPAAIAGAVGENFFDRELGQPWQIGIFLAVGAGILWVADRTAVSRRMDQLGLGTAFAVGCAQVLALCPGVSRSGITISAGRFLGLSRDDSATFSFYLYTPIVAGAVVFKAATSLRHGFPAGTSGPFLVGHGDVGHRGPRGHLGAARLSASTTATPCSSSTA